MASLRTVFPTLVTCLGFVVAAAPAAVAQDDRLPPTVILISADGFRWDYVDRPVAPSIQSLASRGMRARGLIPIFPSKTFPNHYTIVTGLYPQNHGLVANNMYDPLDDSWYGLSDRVAVGSAKWYGGEPVWVTAEKAGQPTAPLYWPGSEAPIHGVRPTHWAPYDGSVTPAQLVDTVLGLFDLPAGQRPTFLTLYFHATDDAGHEYGTTSDEIDWAIAEVDSAIARLQSGLATRGFLDEVDIIVVSDHGMADTSADRLIFLDEIIDLERVTISDWNPVVAIWPDDGAEAEIYRRLRAQPHLEVYRREELPERWHYRDHPRVAPIIGVAEEGWSITTRRYAEDHPGVYDGATHGYDPALESMYGLLVAAGPSFRHGGWLGPTANIHLYELICAILGLTAAPNDGSLEPFLEVVVPEVRAR